MMKIIDKNTDFYDYIQNTIPDEGNIVFDRTDSFILTKEIMREYIRDYTRYKRDKYTRLALLQVGNAFWLFCFNITADGDSGEVKDYTIDFVTKWKNYDKQRKLISLDLIDFDWGVTKRIESWGGNFKLDKLKDNIDVVIQAINTNNYKVKTSINKHTIYKGTNCKEKIEKHIPLFIACGLADYIDPLEIYLAFDEYFSLEKQATERIDAIGTTNKDKIINHGFDPKDSFRGK